MEDPMPEQVDACAGFSQDRVNFHQNPGRGTAEWADPTPTWPNRAGYSIPCAVMLGSGGGGWRGRNSLAAREGTAAVRSESVVLFCGFVLYIPLFSVSYLLLFPLFAVLLNCLYPDPPVFCLFLSILLRTSAGEGQPRGAFVAGRSQTITLIWHPSVG